MTNAEPGNPTHVVGIVGGAVAGSEAAAACAASGALAVVFEQGARPYGKIEDGLPRWHTKLRAQEYARIDENLSKPGVMFVPCTRIGADLEWSSLHALGFSAVLLANGAWRDRRLPVPDVERYVGRGLVYQNPFVYWFNHAEDAGYTGPTYDVVDGAIVVGGGLASIDVVKILNLVLYQRALKDKGVDFDLVDLELQGIDRVLRNLELDPAELGVAGCTLYYRRRMEDMPLATGDESTPQMQAKLQKARVKIMERVMRKYLVRFEPLHVPIGPVVEDDRLAGLVFQRTEVRDGRVHAVDGSDYEVRAPMIISSIGSVPEPIPGVPVRGELYHFADWDTGEVQGLPGVFGLGNVLTGKGNIKDSRANATLVAERVLSQYLHLGGGAGVEAVSDAIHDRAEARAEAIVDQVTSGPPVGPEGVARIRALVERRWREVGYTDYPSWIERHRS